MDYVKAALWNALAEDMTVEDLCRMAEHAETCDAFDDAVNELAMTCPGYLDADVCSAMALMYPK